MKKEGGARPIGKVLPRWAGGSRTGLAFFRLPEKYSASRLPHHDREIIRWSSLQGAELTTENGCWYGYIRLIPDSLLQLRPTSADCKLATFVDIWRFYASPYKHIRRAMVVLGCYIGTHIRSAFRLEYGLSPCHGNQRVSGPVFLDAGEECVFFPHPNTNSILCVHTPRFLAGGENFYLCDSSSWDTNGDLL